MSGSLCQSMRTTAGLVACGTRTNSRFMRSSKGTPDFPLQFPRHRGDRLLSPGGGSTQNSAAWATATNSSISSPGNSRQMESQALGASPSTRTTVTTMSSQLAWPRGSGHILRETANSAAHADPRASIEPCQGRWAHAGGCGRYTARAASRGGEADVRFRPVADVRVTTP